MIRFFDVLGSSIGLILLSPILLLFTMFGFLDTGLPFYMQERVGKKRKAFKLIKFRSMKKGTPSLASHLIDSSKVTSYGKIIRRLKIDELPQLINVFLGNMSLVGARPCLPNQKELIMLRDKAGIFKFRPGITGQAQIKNIDMSNPERLVNEEIEMFKHLSTTKYFQIVLLTISGKGRGDTAS